MTIFTTCKKRNLYISSVFFAIIAIAAYFSPDHLCPALIHIPGLTDYCPYTDATSFTGKRKLVWGSQATEQKTINYGILPQITEAELQLHNGEHDGFPLRLAIDDIVLDIDTTEGRRFYAKGKSYHMFAGGDYTRALALGSLDEKDIERGKDVSDFNIKQQQELMNRIQFYLEKYVAVGLMQGSKHASELKTGT